MPVHGDDPPPGHLRDHDVLRPRRDAGRGNQRHLTVPGAGLVLANAGRYVSGFEGLIRFSGLNIPAGSEFCAALSA